MMGMKEMVEYLVSKDADVFIKNNSDKVPSQEAYEKQFYDISEHLVEKELSLKKGEFEETSVNKNDPDDFIDLDVKIEGPEADEVKENMDKMNLNKK
jgi:hypothetical protein